MYSLVGPDVLAKGSHVVVAEHSCVEGVAAFLRGCRGVCGLTVVGHVRALNCDRVHRAEVAVGRVDHHGEVDVVERPAANHELLAAAALLGRSPKDRNSSSERFGDLGYSDPCADAG